MTSCYILDDVFHPPPLQGADLAAIAKHAGETALFAAAQNNHSAMVEHLITRGSDPSQQEGGSALYQAFQLDNRAPRRTHSTACSHHVTLIVVTHRTDAGLNARYIRYIRFTRCTRCTRHTRHTQHTRHTRHTRHTCHTRQTRLTCYARYPRARLAGFMIDFLLSTHVTYVTHVRTLHVTSQAS